MISELTDICFRDRPEEDYEYDHEAFLGDEAHEFDDLDPEESKVLSIILRSVLINTKSNLRFNEQSVYHIFIIFRDDSV